MVVGHTACDPAIHRLPVEILTYILRLSTQDRDILWERRLAKSSSYLPFHDPRLNQSSNGETWFTRLSLPLVCGFWRRISLNVTYEEIYVGKHFQALLKAFEQSEIAFPGHGFGRQVQRLVLKSIYPNPASVSLSEILHYCPNVTIIVKDDDDSTPTPFTDVDLTSIQRFDWVHFRRPNFLGESYSQGRDFYRDIVFRASNLRYLYIGISSPNSRPSIYPSPPVIACSLETLHVAHIGPILRAELEGWQFPKLRNLITDSSLTHGGLSPLFGPQLEVLEFTRDESLWTYDASVDILGRCPNLKELNYLVEFSPLLPFRHDGVERIGLRSERNYMMNSQESQIIVALQFSAFSNSTCFPSLKHVICYDPWSSYTPLPGIDALCSRMRERGCAFADEYGYPIQVTEE